MEAARNPADESGVHGTPRSTSYRHNRDAGGGIRYHHLRMMMQPRADAFQLTLPIFEGPLDLLPHLIEREELDITNIALVAVTDQYMEFLRSSEQLNLDALADFIYIGARLLLIKSRALLPKPAVDEIVALDEDDPSEDLTRQLL